MKKKSLKFLIACFVLVIVSTSCMQEFLGHTNLAGLKNEDNIVAIGEHQYTYNKKNDTYTLVKAGAGSAVVEVPQFIDDGVHGEKPVHTIGEGAFASNELLYQVKLPISVRTIGSGAFFGCKNLKVVSYPGTREHWRQVSVYPYTFGNGNMELTLEYSTGSDIMTEELFTNTFDRDSMITYTTVRSDNLTCEYDERLDGYRVTKFTPQRGVAENDKYDIHFIMPYSYSDGVNGYKKIKAVGSNVIENPETNNIKSIFLWYVEEIDDEAFKGVKNIDTVYAPYAYKVGDEAFLGSDIIDANIGAHLHNEGIEVEYGKDVFKDCKNLKTSI